MSVLHNLGISYFVDLYLSDNPELKYFYSQMYRNFNPDITGYTLIFMKPPEFSSPSYANNAKLKKEASDIITSVTSVIGLTPQVVNTLADFSKVYSFMATDYTPPRTEVQNSQVQTRTGAISYASDVKETETVSISFLESNPLTIYKFHLLWVEYMRNILIGEIEPDPKYLDSTDFENFGAQDYLASLYIVKYIPDMKTISYISKCIGVFPLSLPSKELIGSRTTNEICVLPFEYSCIAYREYIEGLDLNSWIKKEFNELKLVYGTSIFDYVSSLIS
jgi:hypothetical protein